MYPQLKVNDCRNNHFQLRGYQKFEFLVVTKKKSFFMRRNSKFRLRHVQEKVRTYLCAKYHVSKSCRVFRNITNVFFLIVVRNKSFFMRRNSKFRLHHVQEKVRTYLCAKYHVSKSCRVFRKRTIVFFLVVAKNKSFFWCT